MLIKYKKYMSCVFTIFRNGEDEANGPMEPNGSGIVELMHPYAPFQRFQADLSRG